jgi:hypothetical protein
MRGGRLLVAVPIAIAGAAVVATITRPQSGAAFVVAVVTGALFAGGAAAITAEKHLLLVMASQMFAVMIGGPFCAGLVVGVQSMVDGKAGIGGMFVSLAVFYALGVSFGMIFTIPIGLAFGSICTGWAALVRRMTSSESTSTH